MQGMWKVVVLSETASVIGADGKRYPSPPIGRLAWLPIEESKRLAAEGKVKILSPDGGKYRTEVMTPTTTRYTPPQPPPVAPTPRRRGPGRPRKE